MQKRTLRGMMTWLTLVLVLVLSYTTIGYVRVPGEPSETLEAFPEDCDLVMTVDCIEARRAIDELSWAISEIAGSKIDETAVLDWLQSAFAGSGDIASGYPEIDLKSDVLPWIGREISIGLDYDSEKMAEMAELSIRANELAQLQDFSEVEELYDTDTLTASALPIQEILNYAMFVVSCRDARRAAPFLDKVETIMRVEGLEPVVVTIGGHKWRCAGSNRMMTLLGIVENRLIAFVIPLSKVIPTVERVVSLLGAEKGSVVSKAEYEELAQEAGEGAVFSMLVNLKMDWPAMLLGREASPGESTDEGADQNLPFINTMGLVRMFADSGGIRIRSLERSGDDVLTTMLGLDELDLNALVLTDTSIAVPEYVVGFMQFGPINEYWSIMRSVFTSLIAIYQDSSVGNEADGSDFDSSEVLPEDVLTFVDTLMSHFVGDTHIALTGDSSRPMVVVTSRVRDGEMLVAYLEMLLTQAVPGLQIHFDDYCGEMVKTLWIRTEEGAQALISYCIADEMLIVSNMEPAVRLAIDTLQGTLASIDTDPAVAGLRQRVGDGGLAIVHVDADSLVEFLGPLSIKLTESDARWIRVIERVFDRVSGYSKVGEDMYDSELEIVLKQPSHDTSRDAVQETPENE